MFVMVSRFDRLRAGVEDAIRTVYAKRYGALLSSFAHTIVAELNSSGRFECAAGIRFAHEALFSERYFDLPMERVLQAQLGRDIRREHIVEVSHLAGVNPGRSVGFVRNIIELLQSLEVEWAIFTATKPLRMLLRRSGLPMLELGCAQRSRVGDPAIWGRYFDYDPRIMAVGDPATVMTELTTGAAHAAYPGVNARAF